LRLTFLSGRVGITGANGYIAIMSTLPSFDDISDNLGFLDDWEDRYRYLIELGGMLDPLTDSERSPANKVSGCVSQVWLVATSQPSPDGTIVHFRGDSDAMIVKGLAAALIALYSGKPARFVVDTDAVARLDALGLREHLTSQRSNGLVAMVNRMRAEARSVL